MKLSAGLAVLAMLFGLACGEHFITSNNEILSALTWASFDSKLLTGRSFKTFSDGYNLTQFLYNNNAKALSSPVKKRTLQISVSDPAFMNLEIKLIIPLFEIYEGTFIRFEMPLSYNLLFPTLKKRGGGEWDTSLVPIITHLEDLVSMLGVDGGVCIRRAICELAEAPSLQVHGLVGEVVHILMRHIIEDSMVEDENTINTNEGSDSDNPSVSKGDYIKAGQHGRQKGKCWKAYSECPVSLFNLMASS